MRDYSVQVTYRVGRTQDSRGYVVTAHTEAEAERKGRDAHQVHGEPGTTVINVTAEPL
jgi:hypothetical protein